MNKVLQQEVLPCPLACLPCSGAVAERCKFECYVAYNLMLVMFVYPLVAHW